MSSAPSIKRRLSKPKTNDNPSHNPSQPKRSLSSSSKSRPPPDISEEQWTSYFDLKTRPDGPKNLKQQLKQSFPETKRKLSLDSFRRTSSDSTNSIDAMGVKDRYPSAITTSNLGSNMSPLTTGTPSPLARQLSVVHERPGIDIASAIHMLQELKKTASPEELVALHRALLPMKEEDASGAYLPPREEPHTTQHPSRRNSKLPPGLNTRGAPGDDLLRRLGDEVSRPRAMVAHIASRDSITSAKRSASGGAMTVLDLPEQGAIENPERSETPSDEHGYSQTGVYRTGTLRITNGAASPDPARLLQLDIPEDQAYSNDVVSDSLGSPDFDPGRQIPASVESFPGPFRVLHSQKRQTSRPLPPPPPEPESRRNSDASDVQLPAFDQDMEEANPAARFAQESHDTQPSAETSVPAQFDGATEDPPFVLSHPRRLRHQPSYGGPLRAQHTDTRDEDASPIQIQPSLAQFATRLSTVYGEDDTDEELPGTPNHALAKLTGEPRIRGPREPKSTKSVRSLQSQRPLSMSHVDSGYGSSDASSQRYVPSPKPLEDTPHPAQTEPNDDTESLYTFNEFLKGPSGDVSSAPISHSSPTMKKDRAKKDLPSFLGLRDKVPTKRMSLPTGGLVSSESLTSLTSSVGSEQSGKPSKKLRKPIPLHERLKREKSLRVSPVSELGTDDFPMVSDEMNRSLEQRYHQPTDSEKDLSRRVSMASEKQSIWDDGSRESEVNVPVPGATGQRRNPFSRKRSVSRGRKSQNRAQEAAEAQDTDRSGRFPFLRSLSRSRSRRRASIDSADCNTPTRNNFDTSPTPTGSVTPRALIQRDTDTPKGNESWRTGPPKNAKSKSMGMTEEMASELARSKSRDVGGHDRVTMHDRPRMATPKQSPGRGHCRSPSVGPPKSGRAVEDFLPGWQSKENSPQPIGPPKPDAARRPFSMYADIIPPMPDMPIDVAAKAARANKLMEKKKKDAFRKSIETAPGSATSSAQPSATSSPNLGKVKQAVRDREEQESRLEERLTKDREGERLRVGKRAPPAVKDINIAVRALQGSSSEQSSILSTDSRPSTADRSETTATDFSVSYQKPQQNGFSGFDKQAALWRERRKSLGTYLPSQAQVRGEAEANQPSMDRLASPEIVVSRYITPQGKELAARALANNDPTSEAARHADLYRSLLDEEDSHPLGHDIPRTDSAYSSASSGVSVPKYQGLPDSLASRPRPTQSRTVSGVTTTSSVYSSQYTALPRTRSPGGRVRTPSGNFYAYEPTTHAEHAERSRAASLSKLQPGSGVNSAGNILSPATSTDGLSTIFSDTMTISSCGGTIRAKPKNPHQRHRFPDTKSSKDQNNKPRRPRPVSSHSSNLADRYSGGLGWEWDRQSGFGGSAGTRLNGEAGTRRKGQRLAESYGVDLGDVPIFLSQSPDGLAATEQQKKKSYFAAA